MSIRHTKYRKPPVYEGEIFVEKEPPPGYVGAHCYRDDHDRIGQNGVIWMGCQMCRDDLGIPKIQPRRLGRYWNTQQV